MKRIISKILPMLLALIIFIIPLGTAASELNMSSVSAQESGEEIVSGAESPEQGEDHSENGNYLTEGILAGVAVLLVAVFMLALVFFGVVIMKTGVKK